jgi:N-dimethylarginine dimethylaminohydrolase
MSLAEPKLYGCPSMTAPLRRVLLRAPSVNDHRSWREYGWRAEPDPVAIAREHEALCELLAAAGAEVVLAEAPLADDPDAIYVFDPAVIADRGAVLLRPGKAERRREPESLATDLARAGVPIAGRLESPAVAEGGDAIRLDERTLLVGLGYRTNEAGAEALARLTGLDVVTFDLPHWHGHAEVMHLLSLVSPLADDLVVAYLPLLPTRLAQLLAAGNVEIVPVPDEEFESMGGNVLALAPRVALVVDGNPETRRRLERAGVEVFAYEGNELSKGDGGPTCLTCPLLRE